MKWFQVCGLDIRPCVGSSKGWEPEAVSSSPQSPRVPGLWKDLQSGTKTQRREGAPGRQANTSGALVKLFHCRKQVSERKNSEEEKLLGIIVLKVPVC